MADKKNPGMRYFDPTPKENKSSPVFKRPQGSPGYEEDTSAPKSKTPKRTGRIHDLARKAQARTRGG